MGGTVPRCMPRPTCHARALRGASNRREPADVEGSNSSTFRGRGLAESLLLSVLHATLARMDELSSVIASIGTVVSTVVALFLLRQGQRDRRELATERRRDQAARITTWVDWNEHSPHASLAQPHIPGIFVANASDAAVHEVFVDFYDPTDEQRTRIEIGQVPPGQTRHRDVLSQLPPDPDWAPSALMPRLFFRDSNGHTWMRDLRGRLRADPGPGDDGFSDEQGRLELGIPRPELEQRD